MRRSEKFKVDLELTQEHIDIVSTPASYPFTPDLWRLEKYRLQRLFVCDEWLSDRHQSFVLKDLGERLGKAFTQERFDFLVKSTDPHKTAVPLPNKYGLRIQGEIWAVPGSAFIKLDKLKQNGLQFLRYRDPMLFPYREHGFVQNYDGYFTPDGYELPEALQGRKEWVGDEKIWLMDCWMYRGHPSYWQDMVYTSPFFFERVSRFKPKKDKPWLDEYYHYQNPSP